MAITRSKKIAQFKKGTIFHPDWMHTDYFEYWLKDFVRDGSCLNLCCGYSEIGDVRVDINEDSTRTMEGDLFKILEIFKLNQFDYVYVDPLFDLYNPNSRLIIEKAKELGIIRNPGKLCFQWQFDSFKICKKALITRRPKTNVQLPSKYHEYVIAEDSRPSFTIIRIDYK